MSDGRQAAASVEPALPPRWTSTPGTVPWLLQRVSGLFLAYGLAVHLWAVHVVDSGRLSWDVVTMRLQDGSSWSVYYVLFVPAVVLHALNGVWGIVLDFDPPRRLRPTLRAVFWLGGLALMVYGYMGIRPLLG